MTSDRYPIPAAKVAELLKAAKWGYAGGEPEYQSAIRRSDLMAAFDLPPSATGAFSRQLQDMQRNHFAEHRICFQYYPTGWIYRPIEESTPTAPSSPIPGERFPERG